MISLALLLALSLVAGTEDVGSSPLRPWPGLVSLRRVAMLCSEGCR
jgi:hypothetical protein